MTGARSGAYKSMWAMTTSFMLTYGDGVGDIDLDRLLAFHNSHGKALTVTGVRPPGRFGELLNDANGTVIEFNEKPQATGGRISGGFFVCRRSIVRLSGRPRRPGVRKGTDDATGRDGQLMMYEHDGFWQPMDTNREYQLLNDLYRQRQGALGEMVNVAGYLTVLRGKRVFVTGTPDSRGPGYACALNELGAEVTGYALAAEARRRSFRAARVWHRRSAT